MRVYIAGPMSTLAEHNYPAFHASAEALEAAGYEPVSPAVDHGHPPGSMPWQWYMRRAVALLMTADAVALLDGWEASRGAGVEVDIATALGIPVWPLGEWLRLRDVS